MHSILREIIRSKSIEVQNLDSAYTKQQRTMKSLKKALEKPNSIIAEIKRRSPAHGVLSDIEDPTELAHHYIAGGASAISVLTDKPYFNGCIRDMKLVSDSIAQYDCPVLRKDFIIDSIQLSEAAAFGADAVLLIVAVLQEKTQSMISVAESLGLEVLLEVHNREELDIALDTSATMIGVNNRNLHTLEVNIKTSIDLIQYIPSHVLSVSESGVHDPMTAKMLFNAGFSALLVGEALVRSPNPGLLIQQLRGGRYD